MASGKKDETPEGGEGAKRAAERVRGVEGACPICGKPSRLVTRPFCSKRCAEIDLGRWLKGGYRIAGRPLDAEEAAQAGLGAPEAGEEEES